MAANEHSTLSVSGTTPSLPLTISRTKLTLLLSGSPAELRKDLERSAGARPSCSPDRPCANRPSHSPLAAETLNS